MWMRPNGTAVDEAMKGKDAEKREEAEASPNLEEVRAVKSAWNRL